MVERQTGPGSKGPHQQDAWTPHLPWDSLHLLCLVLILIVPFSFSRVSPWVTIYSLMIRHVKLSGLDPESTREPVKSSGFPLRKNVVEDGLGSLCACASLKAPAGTELEMAALSGKDGHGWSDWKVASGGLGV